MKLKINKACDLSSISVLPPHARRSSTATGGPESSIFSRSQVTQMRSQPSQQSFSQGASSQLGGFSQFSQNSLEDVVTTDQRFGSQERESSGRKNSCLPPINFTRDESQLALTRSSSNPTRKWNSLSLLDHRCEVSEELEHRIRVMETSLSRFGMILDSVQSDIMQVNKGTKEVAMEMESIRQKLLAYENLLQSMSKGQEDIKASLDSGFRSLSGQPNHNVYGKSLQEMHSILSTLPDKIEALVPKIQSDLCQLLTKQMQEIACRLKIPSPKHATPTKLTPKAICYEISPKETASKRKYVYIQDATLVPRIEMGSWNKAKRERANFMDKRDSVKRRIQKRVPPIISDLVESDEEIDAGFSCLLEENGAGMGRNSIEEAKEATQRILRKARRRKRKSSNIIILD